MTKDPHGTALSFTRPTWVEINQANLAANFRLVKQLVGAQVKILAAVKADAYGHGMEPMARALAGCGADVLGVASADEALALSQAGIRTPVLILGLVSTDAERRRAVSVSAEVTVADYSGARLLQRAVPAGRRVVVHVKVDTGMGRLGMWHSEAVAQVRKIKALSRLTIGGLYTHLSSADTDARFTREQIRRLEAIVNELAGVGIRIPLVHAANSSAVLRQPAAFFTMVRPGLMLYGMSPLAAGRTRAWLKPVLSFKTRIAFLKTVGKGRSISYGRTFIAPRRTLIATIPVGYADGYRREFSSQARVLVRGRYARVVGRVCMDQTMIDVGHIPGVHVGDSVVLIGSQAGKRITAEQLAAWAHTIPYEITCAISRRVPRIYR